MHKTLLELPSELETTRLILRPYQVGDGLNFHDMLKRNRKYLGELLGPITESNELDEIEIYVRKLAADWIIRNRFVLSFWEKVSSRYLGHIWIEPLDWRIPNFEMGWFIDKEYQGKGLTTEAAKKALAFIFKSLKAEKVTVRVREHGPYYEKSKQIAERCGFVKEGKLRNSVRTHIDKVLANEFYYGLLKEENEEFL
ncbi:MAG: GNAT family N-acetyltransferase [Candidatus Heimdallarchaeota archaeon]|nr:MAG: GNAT family N-acetyltransferase [Candidatus Heimdallarchaeota archaeon]